MVPSLYQKRPYFLSYVNTYIRHIFQSESLGRHDEIDSFHIDFSGAASSRWMSGSAETDAEFDARYEAYFNRKDIDGWEIRKGMADLGGMDLVPEPAIVAAALRACRRVNDYALTTRILELVKFKAQHNPEIWPYMMQELKPTMDELGIASLEEMGYDKPELAIDPEYRSYQ